MHTSNKAFGIGQRHRAPSDWNLCGDKYQDFMEFLFKLTANYMIKWNSFCVGLANAASRRKISIEFHHWMNIWALTN